MQLPAAQPPLGHRVAKLLVVRARPAVHRAKELDECVRDGRTGVMAQPKKAPLQVIATKLVEAPVEPRRRMALEKSSILQPGTPRDTGTAPEVALEGAAKGRDRRRTAVARRTPLRDGAKHLPGPCASPGGGEGGKMPEHRLAARRPASSLVCAVLDEERMKARWADAHPKASQFVVPDDVAPVPGRGVGHGARRETSLVQRHSASIVRHGVSFAGVIHLRAEG